MSEEIQNENSDSKQRVLVVDDEASIRRILETRLKMAGYDVVTAEDGEEAVEVYNKIQLVPNNNIYFVGK